MDLQGKTAFVTGDLGDKGGAIARALAAAWADVAISSVYLCLRLPRERRHGSS
jgi:NAD(P)-dependent dehydrogenase (short-subunit alcohol dehydrogenase family)